MTTIFSADGTSVPVTVLQAGPCAVTFVRPLSEKGVNVQIGFGLKKEKNVSKTVRGHLKGLPLFRTLKEFRVSKTDLKRGDEVKVDSFKVGDEVEIVGTSKGKGYAGVVKRHHFGGGPRSHGHKHNLRAPGSIGSGWPQMTSKGVKMAGRMGGEIVTVKGLTVADIVPEQNLLVIKGAVPGSRGATVAVQSRGE